MARLNPSVINKVTIIGWGATALGAIASMVSGWVSKRQMEDYIDQRIAERFDEVFDEVEEEDEDDDEEE